MSDYQRRFVKVVDPISGGTKDIPTSELAPGMSYVLAGGSDQPVWLDGSRFVQGPHRHPPFSGEDRAQILFLQESLSDVHPMSFDAWEDGFRRDLNPDQEIAVWVRAARCLQNFAPHQGASPEKRQEAFTILVACMNGTPETVLELLPRDILDKANGQKLVDSFFDAKALIPPEPGKSDSRLGTLQEEVALITLALLGLGAAAGMWIYPEWQLADLLITPSTTGTAKQVLTLMSWLWSRPLAILLAVFGLIIVGNAFRSRKQTP